MDIARPSAVGEENPVTLTVPVNPRLAKVTVKVVEPPATKLAGEGVPATVEKAAGTITATDGLCVIEPLVPTMPTGYVPAGGDGDVLLASGGELDEPECNP